MPRRDKRDLPQFVSEDTSRKRRRFMALAPPERPDVGRATPSLRQPAPGVFSSRLTLPCHLDCRRVVNHQWTGPNGWPGARGRKAPSV
jgi:hypothetical protein